MTNVRLFEKCLVMKLLEQVVVVARRMRLADASVRGLETAGRAFHLGNRR